MIDIFDNEQIIENKIKCIKNSGPLKDGSCFFWRPPEKVYYKIDYFIYYTLFSGPLFCLPTDSETFLKERNLKDFLKFESVSTLVNDPEFLIYQSFDPTSIRPEELKRFFKFVEESGLLI